MAIAPQKKAHAIARFGREKNRAIAFSLAIVAIAFANASRLAGRSLLRKKHTRSPDSAEKKQGDRILFGYGSDHF